MQTFKCFFKILKKKYVGILIYFGIFILLSLANTLSASENEAANSFTASDVDFTIIDRDHSELSNALLSFLSKDNNFKEFEDNTDEIRNAMYYRDIYYALIIPQGFQEDFKSGKTPKTESLKLKDSSFGFLLDQKIDGYFSTLRTYLTSGMDFTTAIQKTENIFNHTIKVSLLEESETKDNSSDPSSLTFFYNFLAYIFAGMLTTTLGPILIIFQKKTLKNRITVSSQTFRSHNLQLAMGISLSALFMVGIFNLLTLFLFPKDLTTTNFLLYIINTICFSTVSVSLAFMAGNLFQKEDSIIGFSVVAPMVIAFLGGIFVPLSVLGDTMLSAAKLMPSYWYIQANDVIAGQTENFSQKLSSMTESLLIQLLFAFAFICIGLMAAKKHRES